MAACLRSAPGRSYPMAVSAGAWRACSARRGSPGRMARPRPPVCMIGCFSQAGEDQELDVGDVLWVEQVESDAAGQEIGLIDRLALVGGVDPQAERQLVHELPKDVGRGH